MTRFHAEVQVRAYDVDAAELAHMVGVQAHNTGPYAQVTVEVEAASPREAIIAGVRKAGDVFEATPPPPGIDG